MMFRKKYEQIYVSFSLSIGVLLTFILSYIDKNLEWMEITYYACILFQIAACGFMAGCITDYRSRNRKETEAERVISALILNMFGSMFPFVTHMLAVNRNGVLKLLVLFQWSYIIGKHLLKCYNKLEENK